MYRSPERLVLETGRVIYTVGDRADCAYLVLRGRIELLAASVGPAMRVAGDLLGELALADGSMRHTTAVVIEDCELLAITSDMISERLHEIDPLVRVCLSALMTRYSETAHLALQSPLPPEVVPVLPVWSDHSRAARGILSFEHELRGGIASGQLDIHFQPIVRLATGTLAGFEALVRWQHPVRGLLYPSDFIPFAETCGVISEITTLCLHKVGQYFPALKAAQRGNASNVERLFVSVNVSGHDLARASFASTTVSLLLDAGIEPEDIKLEVTESVLMQDAERCARTLENCRDQGISVAIDDFGTGYSSLHYLNALPIGVLKMDRSFCQSLLADTPGRKIIGAILHLGRDLGLSVIAEGVEHASQRDLLQAMGCDFGQGYLFGSAVGHAATEKLIDAWRALGDAPRAMREIPPAA